MRPIGFERPLYRTLRWPAHKALARESGSESNPAGSASPLAQRPQRDRPPEQPKAGQPATVAVPSISVPVASGILSVSSKLHRSCPHATRAIGLIRRLIE